MSGPELCRGIGQQRELQTLDDQLLNALFAPAVKEGIVDLRWQDQANENRGWDLLRQLLPLAKFYHQRNPPLSAAIWGIWNTATYLRNNRSIPAMLFEGKRSKEQLFVGLRALVTTAAVHFVDGTATAVVTSPVDMATYPEYTEATLARLTRAHTGERPAT